MKKITAEQDFISPHGWEIEMKKHKLYFDEN